MKACPNCRSYNQDSSSYCASCGTPLPPAGTVYDPRPSGPGQYPPPGYQGPAPRPQKKGSKGWVIGLIALFVVLVLLIPSLSYLLNWDPFSSRVPTLLSPGDGETVGGHYPAFSWSSVPDAEGYEIVVSEEDVEIVDLEVDGNEYQSSYLGDGIYEWTVRAKVGESWNDWSEVCVFFIGNSTFNRHYEWNYDGRTWSWDMMIPASDYYYYKNQPRTYDYASYMTESNEYVVSLSQSLKDTAEGEGWSSFELVSFTLAFVQSLEYTSDSVTTGYDEYPRYPIETLVDEGGDCEDTSVLFATLIQADPIDIDGVLILLPADRPEHMAAGVAGTGIHGFYYEYDGRDYYYCETTGEGWDVGDIPSEYRRVEAEIIQV